MDSESLHLDCEETVTNSINLQLDRDKNHINPENSLLDCNEIVMDSQKSHGDGEEDVLHSEKSHLDADSTPDTKEWSDNMCCEIAAEDNFPMLVKNIQVQKSIISRFLNFYLSGKIQKGLSAKDLLFSIISIMPQSHTKEKFIWDESDYSARGSLFFLTPDDKLKSEIESIENKIIEEKQTLLNQQIFKEIISVEAIISNIDPDEQTILENGKDSSAGNSIFKIERDRETAYDSDTGDILSEDLISGDHTPSVVASSQAQDLLWYRKKQGQISQVVPLIDKDIFNKYDAVTNAAFCTYCNKLLEQWDSSIGARSTIKSFFAIVSLIVMRCRVKTIQNVAKYLATNVPDNYICFFFDSYTIPHRSFLKKSWKALREVDRKTQIMFAKLVIKSFDREVLINNYGKNNILRFAVLAHTADFGMGIISMLQLIATKTDDFKLLFESLYSEETAVSWNRVNSFFEKYMRKQAKQYTYHWARVIDRDNFKDMSCYDNYELAVVTAVFSEKLVKDSRIWNAAWVKSGTNLDFLKQLGYRLYEDYKTKMLNRQSELFLPDWVKEFIQKLNSSQSEA